MQGGRDHWWEPPYKGPVRVSQRYGRSMVRLHCRLLHGLRELGMGTGEESDTEWQITVWSYASLQSELCTYLIIEASSSPSLHRTSRWIKYIEKQLSNCDWLEWLFRRITVANTSEHPDANSISVICQHDSNAPALQYFPQ